jgi:hypothetical protein
MRNIWNATLPLQSWKNQVFNIICPCNFFLNQKPEKIGGHGHRHGHQPGHGHGDGGSRTDCSKKRLTDDHSKLIWVYADSRIFIEVKILGFYSLCEFMIRYTWSVGPKFAIDSLQ